MPLTAPTISLVNTTAHTVTFSWPAATGGNGNYRYDLDSNLNGSVTNITSPYTDSGFDAGAAYELTLTVVDLDTSGTADSNTLTGTTVIARPASGLGLSLGLHL